MFFPDPASHELTSTAGKRVGKVWETRTFTMYPQNAARQTPLVEGAASDKPHCRSTVVPRATVSLLDGSGGETRLLASFVTGRLWGRFPSKVLRVDEMTQASSSQLHPQPLA